MNLAGRTNRRQGRRGASGTRTAPAPGEPTGALAAWSNSIPAGRRTAARRASTFEQTLNGTMKLCARWSQAPDEPSVQTQVGSIGLAQAQSAFAGAGSRQQTGGEPAQGPAEHPRLARRIDRHKIGQRRQEKGDPIASEESTPCLKSWRTGARPSAKLGSFSFPSSEAPAKVWQSRCAG